MEIRKDAELTYAVNGSLIYAINRKDFPRHGYAINLASQGVLPLEITFAGYAYWNQDVYRARRCSHECSIEYVVDGVFRAGLNDQVAEVGPGEIFFVHQGADSFMETVTPLATKRAVLLSGNLLNSLLTFFKLENVLTVKLSDPKQVVALLDEIDAVIRNPLPGVNQQLSVLAYRLIATIAAQNSGNFPPKLHQIMQYIESRIGSRISNRELADYVSLSVSGLHRLFLQHLHVSPVAWILQQKMQRAKELLSYTDLPVKEISNRLGYANQLYFSAEFRRSAGMSPTQYRKRNSDPEGFLHEKMKDEIAEREKGHRPACRTKWDASDS